MMKALQNETVLLLLRWALGLVLVIASADKLGNPEPFAQSITNYKIIGGGASMLVATILPWVEILTGLSLMLGIHYRGGVFLSMLMMLVFTIAVGTALLRGLDITCGCFTQDPNAAKIGLRKFIENVALLAVAISLFSSHRVGWTLSRLDK